MMSLSEFWALVRRGWWAALALAVLGGLSAYAVTSFQTSVFRATATIMVVRNSDRDPFTAQGLQASQSLTRTYASLAVSRAVLASALSTIADLGLSVQDLTSQVEADTVFGTQLIEISAEANSGNDAARIANAVADTLPTYIAGLLAASNGAGGLVVPIVAVRAPIPQHPVRPNRQLNTGLGAVAGLLVGSFIMFTRFWYDDRIRDPSDLARIDVAVLGTLPHIERPERKRRGPWWPLVSESAADGALGRSVREVRQGLSYAATTVGSQVIVVSSPGPGEGKTTLAVNLCLILAEEGKRVILIDGNLRRPRLHTVLGLRDSGGLVAALRGDRTAPVTLPETSRRLRVVTAGGRLPAPPQAIRSSLMADVIRDLRDRADYLVVDAGSILGAPDAVLWLAHADCALLVVRAQNTGLGRLDEALTAVEGSRRPAAGVVINDLVKNTDAGDAG